MNKLNFNKDIKRHKKTKRSHKAVEDNNGSKKKLKQKTSTADKMN